MRWSLGHRGQADDTSMLGLCVGDVVQNTKKLLKLRSLLRTFNLCSFI